MTSSTKSVLSSKNHYPEPRSSQINGCTFDVHRTKDGHSRRRHMSVKRTDETIWALSAKKMESIVKFDYMLTPLRRESKGVYRTNSRGAKFARAKKIASASVLLGGGQNLNCLFKTFCFLDIRRIRLKHKIL